MLATNFGKYTYKNPFMNASGVHCMTIEELDELAVSAAGSFVTKSATLEARVPEIQNHVIPIYR